MKQLPSELCTEIAHLSDTQSAATLRLVNRYFNAVALPEVFRCVELNHGPDRTVSFCELMLSDVGTGSNGYLYHLRHIVISTCTFFIRNATPTRSTLGGSHSATHTTAQAKDLLPRVILAAKWLRTLHVAKVPQSFLQLSCLPQDVARDCCLQRAYIDYLQASSAMFQSITHLSLEMMSPSLEKTLRGEAVFPLLTSFSGPLDVLVALSRHHRLNDITLRDHQLHEGRPTWLSWAEHVDKLLSALKRVPVKSLVVGIDLPNNASSMRSLWCQLPRHAPELESLSVTLRFDKGTIVSSDGDAPHTRLLSRNIFTSLNRLTKLRRLWLHVSEAPRHAFKWSPTSLCWMKGAVHPSHVDGAFQPIVDTIGKRFMDLVSVSDWDLFRLRVDVKAGICATGWRRAGSQWVVAREETEKALVGVMFTLEESRTKRDRAAQPLCNRDT